MAITIKAALYTNSDDAFVAWAPSEFIPGCRGFLLERGRKNGASIKTEPVENRVGFSTDKPKSGDHRPSDEWPFQRFNWTDHAADVGNQVRYRVTAMVDAGSGRPYKKGPASRWTAWATLSSDAGGNFSCFFQPRTCAVAVRRALPQRKKAHTCEIEGAAQDQYRSEVPRLSGR